jgi:hypothetical protein
MKKYFLALILMISSSESFAEAESVQICYSDINVCLIGRVNSKNILLNVVYNESNASFVTDELIKEYQNMGVGVYSKSDFHYRAMANQVRTVNKKAEEEINIFSSIDQQDIDLFFSTVECGLGAGACGYGVLGTASSAGLTFFATRAVCVYGAAKCALAIRNYYEWRNKQIRDRATERIETFSGEVYATNGNSSSPSEGIVDSSAGLMGGGFGGSKKPKGKVEIEVAPGEWE